jgi:hypothetical protein
MPPSPGRRAAFGVGQGYTVLLEDSHPLLRGPAKLPIEISLIPTMHAAAEQRGATADAPVGSVATRGGPSKGFFFRFRPGRWSRMLRKNLNTAPSHALKLPPGRLPKNSSAARARKAVILPEGVPLLIAVLIPAALRFPSFPAGPFGRRRRGSFRAVSRSGLPPELCFPRFLTPLARLHRAERHAILQAPAWPRRRPCPSSQERRRERC